MRVFVWLRRIWDRCGPHRKLQIIEGDTLPLLLPERDLVLARDDGENWSLGMQCPCGCKERIELMLLEGVRPRWDVVIDQAGRPTLHPSVWRKSGCRSHFWVRRGRIAWCD
jgi:hypothetical protein